MIDQLIHRFYYIFSKPDYIEGEENKYNPRYIAKLLGKKVVNGKAFFYFKNRSNYISLFTNGQVNKGVKRGCLDPGGSQNLRI